MKLVADSGSTKTSWLLVKKQKVIQSFETIGMNPFFISEKEIKEVFEFFVEKDDVKSVDFFGAGCSTPTKAKYLKSIFQKIFPQATIQIKTDIAAAVLACSTMGEKSIVSILGTGSAFRIFDGKNIQKRYSSLGYILGDEGSGTFIAKALLRKILYQQFSTQLQQDFYAFFNTNREEIIENVYTKPFPNRYLAQFSRFASQYIAYSEVEQLVLNAFDTFFQNHILTTPNYKQYRLHFVGSIAFHFRTQLHKIAEKYQLEIGKIIAKPIEELV